MIFTSKGSVGLIGLLALGACNNPGPALRTATRRLTTHKVAAIQYASGQASKVLASCTGEVWPDGCAVKEYVKQAKQQGAILVVAPELGLNGPDEPTPDIGDNPGTDPAWPSNQSPYLKMFSTQAQELGIYIVIHLITARDTAPKPFSTQVAFGPNGTVVGRHFKFELFSGEKQSYTAGDDVEVFDTPQLGKVGLLICADIYGDLNLHHKLKETLGARVVAFSSYWTAPGAANFQQSYARNWGVWFVGSNVSSGAGKGGGIYDPEGKVLDKIEQTAPSVRYAEIPAP